MPPADPMHAACTAPSECHPERSEGPVRSSHWSRPAALRTLRAMLRLGFSATTYQIAEQTGSLAVHSDITSVRCLCEADGIVMADRAVSCSYQGTTDAGHRVYRYELHPLVIAAIKRGLLEQQEACPPQAGSAHASPPPQRRTEATHQGRLFDAKLPSYLRNHGR